MDICQIILGLMESNLFINASLKMRAEQSVSYTYRQAVTLSVSFC